MKDLVERLEKATGPDRELDCDIEVAVNGGSKHFELGIDRLIRPTVTRQRTRIEVWRYTESLDAAMALVPGGCPIEQLSWWPKVPEGHEDQNVCHVTILITDPDGFYRAGGRIRATARTPANAVSAAALKARVHLRDASEQRPVSEADGPQSMEASNG